MKIRDDKSSPKITWATIECDKIIRDQVTNAPVKQTKQNVQVPQQITQQQKQLPYQQGMMEEEDKEAGWGYRRGYRRPYGVYGYGTPFYGGYYGAPFYGGATVVDVNGPYPGGLALAPTYGYGGYWI